MRQRIVTIQKQNQDVVDDLQVRGSGIYKLSLFILNSYSYLLFMKCSEIWPTHRVVDGHLILVSYLLINC